MTPFYTDQQLQNAADKIKSVVGSRALDDYATLQIVKKRYPKMRLREQEEIASLSLC